MDFERIYRLYFKDVFLYLRALSASEDTAEEITQETFVKALKSIDTFDGSKDIRAWLFTIARNTYYTYCRRQSRYADEELPENEPDIQPDFTERFADEESAFQIHRFLHGMDEPYKEVFNCYTTLWSEYIEPIFDDETEKTQERVMYVGQKDEIDRIYYGEFDSTDPLSAEYDYASMLAGPEMEIIWER